MCVCVCGFIQSAHFVVQGSECRKRGREDEKVCETIGIFKIEGTTCEWLAYDFVSTEISVCVSMET